MSASSDLSMSKNCPSPRETPFLKKVVSYFASENTPRDPRAEISLSTAVAEGVYTTASAHSEPYVESQRRRKPAAAKRKMRYVEAT